ncbi:MAG: stage V sporulation protein AD [Clostridia bacterium]|nr:stage V sporulation protein AD [Clostridia bacterium]
MLQGRQTWVFPVPPVVTATGTAVGHMESEGPLGRCFDIIHKEPWLGKESFEKAEQCLLEQACLEALKKANLDTNGVNMFLAGDLINQLSSSCFTARSLKIPFLGLFGACSTAMESLALASLLVSAGGAHTVLAATSSHNNAAEKQFRYPNEYGAQKNDTCQLTVTAAGSAVVQDVGNGPKITAVTIGAIEDMGLKDPFNMGAAMAPAAAQTIINHFKERDVAADYYDLILTGDLGRVGSKILVDLLHNAGLMVESEKICDGGVLIYSEEQKPFAGGSGCGCMAAVAYGYIYNEMLAGRLKKALLVATGALMSPLTYQQNESIPGIAHAVALEVLE